MPVCHVSLDDLRVLWYILIGNRFPFAYIFIQISVGFRSTQSNLRVYIELTWGYSDMIMDASVLNFRLTYSKPDQAIPKMCLRMFSRYLPASPVSILDIGCGIGCGLDILSLACPDCWGVDYLSEIIESARDQRPHLHLHAGDMYNVRLGRTFDVIICMESGFMHARSSEDVAKVLETFAVHAHTGTLLILDVLNAASFLNGKKTTANPILSFDRRRQLLVRQRTWNIPGQPPMVDCCRYRSFFHDEIKHLLRKRGFQVVGIFDNTELRNSDLSGLKLYVGSIMSF